MDIVFAREKNLSLVARLAGPPAKAGGRASEAQSRGTSWGRQERDPCQFSCLNNCFFLKNICGLLSLQTYTFLFIADAGETEYHPLTLYLLLLKRTHVAGNYFS